MFKFQKEGKKVNRGCVIYVEKEKEGREKFVVE